ncbi:hypothetical protein Tco_0889929 [Tanacetum coccineum]
MAVIEDCWFQVMQDEIHEFDHLEVWELVPRPIYVMVINLKWILQSELDEYGDVLKTKSLDGCSKLLLNGDLKKMSFVSRLKDLKTQANLLHVYRLMKALYGLKLSVDEKWFDISDDLLEGISITLVIPVTLTSGVSNPDTQFCKYCGESSLKIMTVSKVDNLLLASNNNIHRRPESAVHHIRDDFILGNLKFVPKRRAIELRLVQPFLPQGRALIGGVTIRDPVSEQSKLL